MNIEKIWKTENKFWKFRILTILALVDEETKSMTFLALILHRYVKSIIIYIIKLFNINI